MGRRISCLFVAAGLALGVAPLPVEDAGAHTGDAGTSPPVLVELFTSEGCSSCPPADRLLEEINGKRTASGRLIVGISEHVTYWNRLGWTDPFSSEVYTQRQSGYAERFHLGDVYTPQMVINGREQVVGSNRPELIAALNRKPEAGLVQLVVTSLKRTGGTIDLGLDVDADRNSGAFDIFFVLTDDKDRSQVLRGENASKMLQHVSVARSLQRVATMSGGGKRNVTVRLEDPPLDFTAARHIILFAQSRDFGSVLGVIAVKAF